ncbi:glycosyltransferase family 8 protein [Lysinibacillus parviboronicapiens]|uniref:glycosyltransferase family 8 protein n=1 Tax=Lysinibacillus parviboronicapiens TaxID=436516 RepID=UPI000D3AB13B|nr:glycosyltransferase family 8 protein [Lysinibacillus parviboronicapiens]
MHLACSINKKYIKYFSVMLQSVINNSKYDYITVHILHNNLTQDDIDVIFNVFGEINMLSLKFYKVDNSNFKDFPLVAEHLTVETFYRLKLADLISEDIKKIIYIDSDMIVKQNLMEIWAINLKDYPLAAVANFDDFMYKKIGLKKRLDYFNAGLILINLELWREEEYFEIFIEYAKKNKGKIFFGDQDILNGVLNGNWLSLQPKWNVQNFWCFIKEDFINWYSENEYELIISNPAIIHFSGPLKPWDLINNQVHSKEYNKVLNNMSFWKNDHLFEQLIELIEGEIFIFGTGYLAERTFENIKSCNLSVVGFIDNDITKWRKELKSVNIYSPQDFFEKSKGKKVNLVICSDSHKEILEDLYSRNFNFDYINVLLPNL